MIQNILILQCLCTVWSNTNNYSDTSGSLWQFKRDEIEENVDLNVDDNHIPNNSSSFRYKSSFATNRNGAKKVVPLKYLSNFSGSLEMPLINCKVELSLTWNPNCVLSNLVRNSTFTITDAKLCMPVKPYQQKTMLNCQNYWQKDWKDQFIGINTK